MEKVHILLFQLYCRKSYNEPVLPTTAGKDTAAKKTESPEPVSDPRQLIPVYTYGTIN